MDGKTTFAFAYYIYRLHILSTEACKLMPVSVFPAFEKRGKGVCEELFVVWSECHMWNCFMGTLAFKMFSQQEMEMSKEMAFLCGCNVFILDTQGE